MTSVATYLRDGLLVASVAIGLVFWSCVEVHALVNGQVVVVADQEYRGLVEVGACSGVLLTNRVVLSAAHCMEFIKAPSDLRVNAKWGAQPGASGQSRTAVKFVPFQSPTDPEPGSPPDVVVIILNAPIAVNSTWRGFKQRVWPGPYNPNDLNGRNIDTCGLGLVRFANPVTRERATQGDGEYRCGRAAVFDVSGKAYKLNMLNGAGIGGGDSGGPSFLYTPQGLILTGVHSQCDSWGLVPGMGMDSMWSFVTSSAGCKDAMFGLVWGPIQEVVAESERLPVDPNEREPIPPPGVSADSGKLTNKRPPSPFTPVPEPPGQTRIPNPHPGQVPNPGVSPGSSMSSKAGTPSAGAITGPPSTAARPPLCQPGYVFRLARPQDLVCVQPASRDRVAQENRTAAERSLPGGHCQPGYVWRDAFDGDGVCVTPGIRDLVHRENRTADSRRAQ
jgi:hypothetical protein